MPRRAGIQEVTEPDTAPEINQIKKKSRLVLVNENEDIFAEHYFEKHI